MDDWVLHFTCQPTPVHEGKALQTAMAWAYLQKYKLTVVITNQPSCTTPWQ